MIIRGVLGIAGWLFATGVAVHDFGWLNGIAVGAAIYSLAVAKGGS